MADDGGAGAPAADIPGGAAGQHMVIETGTTAVTISPVAGIDVGPQGELTLASTKGVIAVFAPGRWWHARVVEPPEGPRHGD